MGGMQLYELGTSPFSDHNPPRGTTEGNLFEKNASAINNFLPYLVTLM
jgi:hypothetical protein